MKMEPNKSTESNDIIRVKQEISTANNVQADQVPYSNFYDFQNEPLQQVSVPEEQRALHAPVQNKFTRALLNGQAPSLPQSSMSGLQRWPSSSSSVVPQSAPFHGQTSGEPSVKKRKLGEASVSELMVENFELKQKLDDLEQRYRNAQESSARHKSELQATTLRLSESVSEVFKLEELLAEKNRKIRLLNDDVKYYFQKYNRCKETNFQLLDEVKSYREQQSKATEEITEHNKTMKSLKLALENTKLKAQSAINASKVLPDSLLNPTLNSATETSHQLPVDSTQEDSEDDGEIAIVFESIKSSHAFVQQLDETAQLSVVNDPCQAQQQISQINSSSTEVSIEGKDETVHGNDQEITVLDPTMLPSSANSSPSVANLLSQTALSVCRQTLSEDIDNNLSSIFDKKD